MLLVIPVGLLLRASDASAQFAPDQLYPQSSFPSIPQASPQTSQPTSPYVASVSLLETLTNNVNLSPSGSTQGDLVTQLTPSLSVVEKGARTSLNASIAAPILLYARTASENNQAYAQAAVTGTVEAVEKFFFVDGAVNVSQQYLTPLGAVPLGLANATQNRYTSQTYSTDPYIKGVFQGGVNYELRDNNIWVNLSGSPISLSNSYTNELIGRLAKDPIPWGWSVDYDGTRVKFNNQGPIDTELARARLAYQVDPELRVSADAGYEDNRYPLASSQGPIYGIDAHWQPTQRTDVKAGWEHRFFGASYYLAFDHRTPLSVWSVNASRNITTYPQQLATLPAGSTVALLLDQLLLTSIPDPGQRQAYINQLIQSGGLPTLTSAPINFYTQQILLQETATATVGLLGARNRIFLTAYYLRNEPISGSGQALPGLISSLNNNTQTGGNIVWTHNLTSATSLSTGAFFLRTVANAPPTGTTRQGWIRVMLTTDLSPRTSVYAGARYQVLRSDITNDYNEAAVFVGLTYTYR